MMYGAVELWPSVLMVAGGLAALAWSSDRFVVGSSRVAHALGISPFVIGMVIIGFGTSAPELCVSVLSGLGRHSNLSLGNAYGSCVFNISAILGVAALIRPLAVKPSVSFVAGPGLAALSIFALFVLRDGACSRFDAVVFLVAFVVLLPLYCWFDQKVRAESGGRRDQKRPDEEKGSLASSCALVAIGLVVLVASSQVLVWGAIDLAKALGVSDLVIGLTVVAVGTSLPELASAIASARRGEHEFVLGNIVGSNLFNTLAVVGAACVISPLDSFSTYILTRDLPLMAILSLSILMFGVNFRAWRRPGLVGRVKAGVWFAVFVGYTVLMFLQETGRI